MQFLFAVSASAMVASICLAPIPAMGAFFSGNDLLEKCENSAELGICIGYVEAVADSLHYFGITDSTGKSECVPTDATSGQIKDIVIKYMRDNPSQRNMASYFLTEVAIIEAWYCKFPELPAKDKATK